MGILGAVFRTLFRVLETSQARPITPWSLDCKQLQGSHVFAKMGIRSRERDFDAHFRALSPGSMPLFRYFRGSNAAKLTIVSKVVPLFRMPTLDGGAKLCFGRYPCQRNKNEHGTSPPRKQSHRYRVSPLPAALPLCPPCGEFQSPHSMQTFPVTCW